MDIHVQVVLIALLGMALRVVLKFKTLSEKSRRNNIKFSFQEYISQDWLSLLASVITIGIFFMLFDNIASLHVKAINYMKFLFAFVGYTGSDIIIRLFSVADKKINNIIDAKTTVADTLTNNLMRPTHIEEGNLKKK